MKKPSIPAIGSSGVGKTTLINRLIGQDAFDTKAVSGTGECMHTTSRRQLIFLSKADTPGMPELGRLGAGEEVDHSFQEILQLSVDCRYKNCDHTQGPGCVVRAAVMSGVLSDDRYSSYRKLIRKRAETRLGSD